MKVFFRNIHLYLSLAAGLVIMTCCFTGAVLVFEKELQEGIHPNRYFVKQEKLQLPIARLLEKVAQKYPAAKVNAVKLYPDPTRTIEVSVSIPSKGSKGHKPAEKNEVTIKASSSLTDNEAKNTGPATSPGAVGAGPPREAAAGGGRPSHTVFVNPYSGEIIELYNYRDTFFYTMFSLHRWLLGSESSIGKTITGIATCIFLFILITGIILWWPRNKAILIQRLKIKSDASFKRLNHDLHIVLGFYSAIFLFIFAFTAMAWSFKWFNNGIYAVTKSSMKPAVPPHSNFITGKKSISYDSAFIAVSHVVTDVLYYSLKNPNDSTGVFAATVLPLGAHETATDTYYIDQYSGQVIGSLQFKDKNLGQRIRYTFKPVHVGSIYGLPSKIVALLVCILGTTFPITGTIMWLNRLRKKKKQRAGNSKALALVDEEYGID
jgi:uncharacterized iron-regulated membrane protein